MFLRALWRAVWTPCTCHALDEVRPLLLSRLGPDPAALVEEMVLTRHCKHCSACVHVSVAPCAAHPLTCLLCDYNQQSWVYLDG
jgi:hypothetical protein